MTFPFYVINLSFLSECISTYSQISPYPLNQLTCFILNMCLWLIITHSWDYCPIKVDHQICLCSAFERHSSIAAVHWMAPNNFGADSVNFDTSDCEFLLISNVLLMKLYLDQESDAVIWNQKNKNTNKRNRVTCFCTNSVHLHLNAHVCGQNIKNQLYYYFGYCFWKTIYKNIEQIFDWNDGS